MGVCLRTLTGHTDNVWYLQFDEDKIVSGSADKSICFWDIRTGKAYNTLTGIFLHPDSPTTLFVVVCCSMLLLSVFLFLILGHERGLSCLHFEDDLLMSGSADKTIKLWDLRKNTCRLTLSGHTEAVYCLYYFNHRLITGGEDTTARVTFFQQQHSRTRTHSLTHSLPPQQQHQGVGYRYRQM